MTRISLALAWLSLVACGGDVRAPFVGTYNTSSSTVARAGIVAQTMTSTETLIVSFGNASDQIALAGGCPLSAKVTSSTAFTLNPVSCPPATNGDCQYTMNVEQGSGTLKGSTLDVGFSGSGTVTCPSLGTRQGTFTVATTGTKTL